MKKSIYMMLCLILAMITQAAVPVDDFESCTVGTITSPWIITGGTPVIAQESDGNQYQESYGSYLALGDLSIPDSDTESTVFYRIYKPAGTNPDCSVGLSYLSEPTGDWTNFEAYVVVYNGSLQARNNSGNTTILSPMAEATWYNIWLVLNNNANTYDVYVTTGQEDAAGTLPLADDFGFRNDAGDLLTFKIYGRSANGPVWVDDIYVSSGTDLSIPSGNSASPASVISHPSDTTVNETQAVAFETVFTSQTTPSVQWYKVAAPADILMDPAESNVDVQLTYDSQTEQYTSVLTLTALTAADAGLFYCQLNNDSGYPRNTDAAELTVYGLVAHWTLDQDSYVGGTYLEQVAGYDALVNGTPVFVTGADGTTAGAVQISTSDGWALCPTIYPANQSGQMTVSFWADWNETQVTQQDLIAESSNEETLNASDGLKADGRWQHICTVFDGTTGRLYIDGVLQDQTSWQTPAGSEANINIGCDINSQNVFNGAIDDMRLFNYALTDAQVADLRTAFIGSSCPQYDLTGPEGQPDCTVDIYDLRYFAAQWLTSYNLSDFAAFASQWLSAGQ